MPRCRVVQSSVIRVISKPGLLTLVHPPILLVWVAKIKARSLRIFQNMAIRTKRWEHVNKYSSGHIMQLCCTFFYKRQVIFMWRYLKVLSTRLIVPYSSKKQELVLHELRHQEQKARTIVCDCSAASVLVTQYLCCPPKSTGHSCQSEEGAQC